MNKNVEVIQYETTGTCSRMIQAAIDEEGRIVDAGFLGGCNGNLKGIVSLIRGMKIDDVIEKLQGITCGDKPTSCPDQLARCIIEYKNKTKAKVKND